MLSAVRRLFRSNAKESLAAPEAPIGSTWQARGNEALARGDLRRAAECYREGTVPAPGQPVAWLNLGFVQLELQQHDSARESLLRAERMFDASSPQLPDVWALLGRERQERDDWASAEREYERVVARVPTHELVWRELGQVREKQERLAEAEDAYVRAVALHGEFEPALRDLARLLVRMERSGEALPLINRCLKLPQPHPEAHLLQACAFLQHGQLEQSLDAVDRALAAGADRSALIMRGTLLASLRRFSEALECHDDVLARDAAAVESWVDSARALVELGRFEDAFERLSRAQALQPGRAATAATKAWALMRHARPTEALAVLQNEVPRGVRQGAEAAFLEGYLHLQLGELQRGWPGFEARWDTKSRGVNVKRPDFGVPQWKGEPLSQRSILVYCEQGLGDSIQMLRFLPQLASAARKVWLRLQAPLWPTLGTLPSNCSLVREGTLPEQLDFACPLMSLPGSLGTSLETIPAAVPYLKVPQDRLVLWRQRLGPRTAGLRVGLVWSGNPDQTEDHNRSIPLHKFLAYIPEGVEFVSLQKAIRPTDADALRAFACLRHFGDELKDFGDTAAVASQMDLVISVCTSVGHLAGALGLPLAVLLCHSPDWRWMLDRDDSPWYPSARLFRQPAPGDWDSVIAAVMTYVRERATAITTPAST
jgi:tetratricopeptide (TPR) repeat protein